MGTEHILLALLRGDGGTAAGLLAPFGVTHDRVQAAVVQMLGLGVEAPDAELSFTGRAEDVIDRARREASNRDQAQAGTEHILLALIREPGGAAARILLQLDVDTDTVRNAIEES